MVEAVCSLLWGWHVLAAILAAGAFFTLETGFYQLRCAGRWLKAALCRPAGETGKLSSFQALSTALAGSIGTGNIVGVAAAITVGGPGALFWMWASALLGMMTIYAENALAARYRTPGAPGALGYIRRAGKWGKPLAALYAGGCCMASLGMGNMAQTHAAAAALNSLGVAPWVAAVCLGVFVFVVARGGLTVGAKIAQGLVPAMTLLFFGASLGVLWVFRENLPAPAFSKGPFPGKPGPGALPVRCWPCGKGFPEGCSPTRPVWAVRPLPTTGWKAGPLRNWAAWGSSRYLPTPSSCVRSRGCAFCAAAPPCWRAPH